jgi:glutaminyl-tRNA synthetase
MRSRASRTPICTLEFEDHRPLYDWFIDNLPVQSRPRQYEFGRLNTSYTVTSKRKLKQLVDEGIVSGWDDPRMPTIAGMRRRGYTPGRDSHFCDMVGTSRSDGVVDVAMLEHAIRDDLNQRAARHVRAAPPAADPAQPAGRPRPAHGAGAPETARISGSRSLPFSAELYIDAEDFREEANKKFKRLVLGKRVRLRNAYVIEAVDVEKDAAGEITAVIADVIEGTLGEDPADGVKPKGVIHWVEAGSAVRATCASTTACSRTRRRTAAARTSWSFLNPDSLRVIEGALVEPGLAQARRRIASSSSARAISWPTASSTWRSVRSSTAPSACATSGPGRILTPWR